MRSKLALVALVAASFVGATTMASAQTQPGGRRLQRRQCRTGSDRHQDEAQEDVVQQEVGHHDRHEQEQEQIDRQRRRPSGMSK